MMTTYRLTLKDKIYFFFHRDRAKRIDYLFPKVKEHELNWYCEYGISIPIFFDRHIYNHVESLIFEYDLRK